MFDGRKPRFLCPKTCSLLVFYKTEQTWDEAVELEVKEVDIQSGTGLVTPKPRCEDQAHVGRCPMQFHCEPQFACLKQCSVRIIR